MPYVHCVYFSRCSRPCDCVRAYCQWAIDEQLVVSLLFSGTETIESARWLSSNHKRRDGVVTQLLASWVVLVAAALGFCAFLRSSSVSCAPEAPWPTNTQMATN